jgi:hypothetical protein
LDISLETRPAAIRRDFFGFRFFDFGGLLETSSLLIPLMVLPSGGIFAAMPGYVPTGIGTSRLAKATKPHRHWDRSLSW